MMIEAFTTRAAAAALAVTAFIPWYSSHAQVDHDAYLGNPLPWIDWLLLGLALTTVIQPQLAVVAAVVGLIDVTLGALLMYGDSAEGLAVSLLPGLPLAAAASVALLIFRPKPDSPKRSQPTVERTDRVRISKASASSCARTRFRPPPAAACRERL